ncbi:MAG: hypothetical protein HRT88_22470, partial [Lentisphaeraceae bacterium]|nr:hypothetical protein [Lentisphaeraceae bacterium]
MKTKAIVLALLLCLVSSINAAIVNYSEVGLTADLANSDASFYGGSQEKTLDDPLVYNPNDPTSVMPELVFSSKVNNPGYHGDTSQVNEINTNSATLSYTLTDGPLSLSSQDSFVIDLNGRAS